jgi:hypothetical protein
MAQFGRPEADITNQSYTEDDGSTTTDMWDQIDEAVADDADYIQSALAPTSDVYVTRFSDLEDPVSSSGHVVRYRIAKSAAGGAQIDATVQLRQGYVSEASLGTLIKEWTHTNVSETITTHAQTLAGAEADAITDYTSLFLRVVFNQV